MKLIYTILICLSCFVIHAQDSIITGKLNTVKHELGITYAPEYNYRFLQAESNVAWIKNIADSMETPKFGFATGLNYSYKSGDKTSLTTGLLFSDNGEKTKNNINLQTVNYTNHYYFVSIPLRLDYTIYAKKIRIYSTLGISGNFFVNHKTVLFEEGKQEAVQFTNRTDLAAWNIGGIAGLGMNAKLSENWFFKLEVLYKQSITPVNHDPVKKWLYALGPNFGLFYSFNKK